jgi:hypothetical protein
MSTWFLLGLQGLGAWPGLIVIVGLAFIALGADLARHDHNLR